MALATYELLVDWNNDGDFGDTGEDVTARLLAPLVFERGRDFASQLTGRSISARLTAILDNTSGDYSSFNTASPLTGLILPGRKVQLKADSNFQFVGFLRKVDPISHADERNTAILVADGALSYLNEKDVEIAMATSKATGDAIDDVLDAVGWPAGDRDIDTGQTTMTRFWLDQQKTLPGLRVVERTEGGFLREKANGDVRFEDRHRRLKSPHTVSQATFSDAVGAALGYSNPRQQDPLPTVFNEFPIDVQTFTVESLAIVWTHPETGSSSPFLAPGESRTFLARYPTPSAPSDAVAINAWTTPVATTDFLANSQSGGGGTNLTGDIAVAVEKVSQTMDITLTNNGATGAFITFLQARGTPITRADVVRVTAVDSASQATYGQRTFPPRQQFVPGTSEAQDWADFQLSIYKDTVPILEITVSANIDAAHMTQVLTRDISDRITVVAATGVARSGLGINEDFFIEYMKHRISENRVHTVTWGLSPASGFSNFWLLGTSKLDTETVLAY